MKVCPVCGKEYSDTSSLCTLDAEVLQSVDDPLLGQTLAEKYFIEQLIKRGGMGSVYRGKHVMMDKTVAIKVLRPSLAGDDVVVARFSREAKAASRISHPHAVSVTDFGEAENGVVFLVMEYLDGRTLKDVIRSEGPMVLDRAVEIVRQVSGALDAAHQQGVIHRDLKSDNIMLSQTNGGDWAKVLDFGIAKIQQPEGTRDNDITAANLVIGTPQYMSPEQCSQTGPIDARCAASRTARPGNEAGARCPSDSERILCWRIAAARARHAVVGSSSTPKTTISSAAIPRRRSVAYDASAASPLPTIAHRMVQPQIHRV